MKTAPGILLEYGIDIMRLNDDFNSQLLAAMDGYAKQQSIEFASYICKQGYSPHEWMDSTFVDHNNNGEYEAIDLYEDFQQSKSTNI